MRVLVTGGAGYIGSHTCLELLEAGHKVFVIDNLSNGNLVAIKRVKDISNCDLGFLKANILDGNILDEIFQNFKPDVVIHFAGLKAVGESVVKPLMYYNVNVSGTISLLEAMSRAGCHRIVFSSSATVYGEPKYLPYDEKHPTFPVNPYGRTKLVAEDIIRDWVTANYKRRATALRYFNPVGAHSSGQIGEDPQGNPNNLMPYIAQVAVGQRNFLKIFGNTYKTKDGTGLRDYIHVVDLATAHIKALNMISKLNSFEILNIGRGQGITVLELVRAFEKASGVSIKYKFEDCRQGDLPSFWADSSRAEKLLDWKPQLEVDQMCKDTWRWHKNNPTGYK
tara:strand:+ start:631 stop:1641 length:1011 start_codon:yes stop_codon:yes gene_type:complete